jgi:hypothetical protein
MLICDHILFWERHRRRPEVTSIHDHLDFFAAVAVHEWVAGIHPHGKQPELGTYHKAGDWPEFLDG